MERMDCFITFWVNINAVVTVPILSHEHCLSFSDEKDLVSDEVNQRVSEAW